MEMWKAHMLRGTKEKVRDIRICGDCGNTRENPNVLQRSRNILLCNKTLTPVHRARSVSFCQNFIPQVSHDQKRTETKKEAKAESI